MSFQLSPYPRNPYKLHNGSHVRGADKSVGVRGRNLKLLRPVVEDARILQRVVHLPRVCCAVAPAGAAFHRWLGAADLWLCFSTRDLVPFGGLLPLPARPPPNALEFRLLR